MTENYNISMQSVVTTYLHFYIVWKSKCVIFKISEITCLFIICNILVSQIYFDNDRVSFMKSPFINSLWIQKPTYFLRFNTVTWLYNFHFISVPVIYVIKFSMKRRTVAFIANRSLFTILINPVSVISPERLRRVGS